MIRKGFLQDPSMEALTGHLKRSGQISLVVCMGFDRRCFSADAAGSLENPKSQRAPHTLLARNSRI